MIYYLGFYGNMDARFSSSPAADTVMQYVSDKLSGIDNTNIISPAISLTGRGGEFQLKRNLKYIVAPYKQGSNLFARKLSAIKRYYWTFRYFVKNLKQNDVLVVYHSLVLMPIVKLIKKRTRCKLILQICEIYGDVAENQKTVKKELEFFKLADSYIFSSELLEKRINTESKKFTVLYGTYRTEKKCEKLFTDNKIHVVYAGTLDPRKGGAAAAVAAAEYLNGDYFVHILGFGGKTEQENLMQVIKNIVPKTECLIKFEGCKKGKEYLEFIQSCDIGLSTQNPDAAFNATSFPSKILSYMANGLRVVSIKIPAIEISAIGNVINFYEKQTPQEIARAIKTVDFKEKYDGRELIAEMDRKFEKTLEQIIY